MGEGLLYDTGTYDDSCIRFISATGSL